MRRLTTLKAIFLLLIMVVVGTVTLRDAAAAGGRIYVSPATTSVQKLSNFNIGVRITPPTGVVTVNFTLSWDSNKVRYLGADTTQSAFGSQLQQSVSGNSLTVVRYVTPPTDGVSPTTPVTADSLIANVSFQALTDSGSSALTLTNANANDPNGNYVNPTIANGTVNFTAIPSTPAPTPTPVTPPTTTSGGGSTTAPKPTSGGTTKSNPVVTNPTSTVPVVAPVTTDTTPPKLEEVQITKSKLLFNNATISFNTDEPTQVYIKYGLGKLLDQQTALSDLSTSHSITLSNAGLLPGQNYSYQVLVKDGAGNFTNSPVKSFRTKGYTLRVVVLGKDNKPLKNVSVILHSDPMTAKTDSHGMAVFNDVAPGNHHVDYTASKKQYSQAVAVDDNFVTDQASGAQSAPIQNVAVQYPVSASSSALLPSLLLVLVLAFAGYLIYWRRDSLRPMLARIIPAPASEMPVNPYQTSANFPSSSPTAAPTTTPIESIHRPDALSPGTVVPPEDDKEREL